MNAERWLNALHEAGHVIVGREVGIRVAVARLLTGAMLSRDHTYTIAGYVMQPDRVVALDPDDYCAYLMGGKMAVRELAPESFGSPIATYGPSEDTRQCRALLEARDPTTADRDLKRAEMRALAVVMKYPTLTTELAKELNRRSVLFSEDIDAFLWAHQTEATR